jgi:ankyrin repeat protein
MTILHDAIERGLLDMADCIIQSESDINVYNKKGRAPIHIATELGLGAVVDALLRAGANINISTKADLGLAPIHVAVALKKKRMMDLLIAKGADVNIPNVIGQTALHILANMDWALGEVVAKKLIDRGADVNRTDYSGYSPLHFAAKHGSLRLCQLFVEHKADVNARCENTENFTPLALAVQHGYTGVAIWLLDNGASGFGTPAHWPCIRGEVYLFDKLVKAGMSLSTPRRTPLLHYAVQTYDNVDMVNFLVDKDVDLDETGLRGNTALHKAMVASHCESAKILLQRGADACIVNEEGLTPLDLASEDDVWEYIDAGVDPYATKVHKAHPAVINARKERVNAIKQALESKLHNPHLIDLITYYFEQA